MSLRLLLFVAIVQVAALPTVIHLDRIYAGGTATIDNIETGAQVFLASSDSPKYLQGIELTTGTTKITLDQINTSDANDNPLFLTITDGLTIRTSNSDSLTSSLSGYLFVTSKQQADDKTFSVRVIRSRHFVQASSNSTVVILNTIQKDSTDFDAPIRTSYVTGIQQPPTTNLYFHWGYPDANWTKVSDNQFFENPLYPSIILDNGTISGKQTAFFDNVEPLQINLDYWYLTTNGAVSMVIENKYVSNHNYTTTSVNTTGLVVNSLLFDQHVVNFLLDYSRSRIVGTLVSTFPNSESYISFFLSGSDSEIDQNYNNESYVIHALLASSFQASSLVVNATSLNPGVFYCQYYGFTGDLIPTTSAPSTTPSTLPSSSTTSTSTTTVMTTTKLCSTLSISKYLIVLLTLKFLMTV